MKTLRIVLIAAVAQFIIWWTTYGIWQMSGYVPFGTPDSLRIGYVAFGVLFWFSFPLDLDSLYSAAQHLPSAVFVALNSCIWGLCLGGLVYGVKRIRHAYAGTLSQFHACGQSRRGSALQH